MPNRLQGSLLKMSDPGRHSAKTAGRRAVPAKRLEANNFSAVFPNQRSPRVRLGCWSFQKLKKPLRHPPAFGCKPIGDLCVAQNS